MVKESQRSDWAYKAELGHICVSELAIDGSLTSTGAGAYHGVALGNHTVEGKQRHGQLAGGCTDIHYDIPVSPRHFVPYRMSSPCIDARASVRLASLGSEFNSGMNDVNKGQRQIVM